MSITLTADPVTMRLKPDVSAAVGFVLLCMALAIPLPPLVIGMIDKNLPLLITALVPMIPTIAGLYLVVRRQNADRIAAREREIKLHAETGAKLEAASERYSVLAQRFDEFRFSAKQRDNELHAEMVVRDKLIDTQVWKIDELTRRVTTQSLLINSVEHILKSDEVDILLIRAAYHDYNGMGKPKPEGDAQ